MTDYERIKREYDLSLLHKGKLMDKVWPIGSIYISMGVDPSTVFGGVWRKIEDAFLFGASKTHPLGEVGGEETHTLTTEEMPSHTHKQADMHWGSDWLSAVGQWSAASSDTAVQEYTTQASGGDMPHNNMPPYLAVSIWTRIK